MSTTQINQPTFEMLIEDFGIYVWLAALSAVGFGGACLGLFGWAVSVLVFILAFAINLFTLNLAFNARQQKDALKQLADGAAVVGVVAFLGLTFASGLIAGLVGLIFCLQIALNLSLREHRQVYFGLLIAFVALMAGAVHTFSASYLFYMLAFCLVSCFYMAQVFVDRQRYAHANIDDRAINPDPIHEQADTAGQVVYVGNWGYGKRVLLAVMISVLAGFIYLVTPHLPAGNLGASPLIGFNQYENNSLEEQILPEDTDLSDRFYEPEDSTGNGKQGTQGGLNQQAGLSGNTDQNGGSDAQSDSNQAQGGMPSDQQHDAPSGSATSVDDSLLYYVKSGRPRYLQTETQTYFDGRSWQPLQYGWKKLPEKNFEHTLYDVKPNASVDIIVAKGGSKHLLTTDNTVGVEFANSWVATNYYDQLKVGEPLKKDTQYQLHLTDEFAQNRLIDTHQAPPDDKDLQLPDDLDPRIAQLSQDLTAQQSSDWEKALALETHLRRSYEYTLDTLPQQNNVPLADFLFGTQRGHCEYFATAMAVMLRQQGIPARMVTGYAANDYNPVTGFYEVKGTNGHAWVSAYVDGSWAVFEATGAYPTPTLNPYSEDGVREPQNNNQTQSTHSALKDYLSNLTEQDNRISQTEVELSLLEQIKMLLHLFWYKVLVFFGWLASFIKQILWLLVLGIAFIAAGIYLYRRYRTVVQDKLDLYRLKRLDITADKTSLQEAMALYQRMLYRHGITRWQGNTIERFSQQMLEQNLMDQGQAEQLVQLINGCFYHTSSPKTDMQEPNAQESGLQTPLHEADLTAFFVGLYRFSLERL